MIPTTTLAYRPADTSIALVEYTVGDVLRAAAADAPNPSPSSRGRSGPQSPEHGPTGSCWRIGRAGAARCLARFAPGEHVAVWAEQLPGVGDPRAGGRPRRARTWSPSTRPAAARAGVRAGPVARPRASSSCPSTAASPMAEIARGRCAASCPRCARSSRSPTGRRSAPSGRTRPGVACGRPAARRADPVHLRHHRPPQGRRAAPPRRSSTTRGCTAIRLGLEPGNVQLSGDAAVPHRRLRMACSARSPPARTLILLPQFDPGLMLELIETERAASPGGVPTMLVAHPRAPATSPHGTLVGAAADRWRGAAVPPELVARVEAAFDARFSIVFGQTEASPVHHIRRRPDDASRTGAKTLGTAAAADRGEDRRPRIGRRPSPPMRSASCARAATWSCRLLRRAGGDRCGDRRRRLAAHR